MKKRTQESNALFDTASRHVIVGSVILAAAITGASGFVEGRLSNRWATPVDLLAAGQGINNVPESFGDWELQTARTLDRDVVEMLQCVGSTQRIYRNRKAGQVISMFLIVGPPGPTSVHTPEICYSSRDYDRIEERKELRVHGGQQAEDAFWAVTFRRADLRADILHVAYAWNAGHGWQAPDQPRFFFGRYPLLYKLQVAGVVGPDVDPQEDDPCQKFLQDFLPALNEVLFRTSLVRPSA